MSLYVCPCLFICVYDGDGGGGGGGGGEVIQGWRKIENSQSTFRR